LSGGWRSSDSPLDIGVLPFWSTCVFALSVIVIHQLAKTPET
jgi:hypothetical protein